MPIISMILLLAELLGIVHRDLSPQNINGFSFLRGRGLKLHRPGGVGPGLRGRKPKDGWGH